MPQTGLHGAVQVRALGRGTGVTAATPQAVPADSGRGSGS